MSNDQQAAVDTLKRVSAAIDEAHKTGQFMIAVFSIDENGVITCKQNSHRFGCEIYNRAIDLFCDALDQATPKIKRPEPLPVADNFFGGRFNDIQ